MNEGLFIPIHGIRRSAEKTENVVLKSYNKDRFMDSEYWLACIFNIFGFYFQIRAIYGEKTK